MSNFWHELKKKGAPIIALAPMAGVTDAVFRRICKQNGADVIYNEFVSVNALFYDSKKTLEMLKFHNDERPIVCQIFGRDPEMYRAAAKKLAKYGFDGIDINFGCPAYKVVKSGGGVSLMRNPSVCHELIQATIEASPIPVSIKIRSSINTKASDQEKKMDQHYEATTEEVDCTSSNCATSVTAADLIKKVRDLDISAIMIHGRSYETPFDGAPNIEMIRTLRDLYDGVLLANGGIHTPEYAKELMDATGADGVGVARGSWGQPWIFQQIKDLCTNGNYHTPTWEEKLKIITDHATYARDIKGSFGMVELRKHLAWYVKGLPGAKELRSKLVITSTIEEIQQILMNYQVNQPHMNNSYSHGYKFIERLQFFIKKAHNIYNKRHPK